MKKSIYSIMCLATVLMTACVDNSTPPEIATGESPVKINEAYSRGKSAFYAGLDWVELYNTSAESVDISGFVLSDKSDKSEKITIPAGTKLAGHGFLKVDVDTPEGFGLSSGGDMVYLYDTKGAQVDYIEFGAMEENESYARVPDGSATFKKQTPTPGASNNGVVVNPTISETSHNPVSPTSGEQVVVTSTVAQGQGTVSSVVLKWTLGGAAQSDIAMKAGADGKYTAAITKQAAGSKIEYTVAAKNSAGGEAKASGSYTVRDETVVNYTGLVINEVDGNSKFVELYNGSKAAISLTGVHIIKNEKAEPANVWWTGGVTNEIAPGGYVVIISDKNPADATLIGASGISPKKNVKFELRKPDGTAIDAFTRSTAIALDADCTPDYGKTTPKYAFARCPDGTGAFGLAEPSPRAANPATAAGAIETK